MNENKLFNIDYAVVGWYDNLSTPNRANRNSKLKKGNGSLGISTIGEIAHTCKNDLVLKDYQDELNSITDEQKRKDYKKYEIPCFTVCGTLDSKFKNLNSFSKSNLSKENSFTGIVFGDIDKLEGFDMTQIKQVLVNDPNIFWIKQSSSEKGFHFFFKINIAHVKYYKSAILAKYKELETKFNVDLTSNLDTAVTNWNRQCLFSYDPNSYWNTKGKEVFDVSNLSIDTDYSKSESKATREELDEIKSLVSSNTSYSESQIQEFNNYIISKKLEWSSGNRSKFISSIHYITNQTSLLIQDVISLSLLYIANDYTSDYTEQKIIKNIHHCYLNYNSDSNKIENNAFLFDSGETLSLNETGLHINEYNVTGVKFDRYLNDNVNSLSCIYKKLEAEKSILVVSQTGTGKTTSLFEFINKYNLKTDFIFPTQALTLQQKSKSKTLIGKQKLDSLDDLVVCSTYDSLFKLQDRYSDLLIIDECHMLVTEYSFRYEALDYIKNVISSNKYKYVIYLTATPQPIEKLFKKFQIIDFFNDSKDNTKYTIVKQTRRKFEHIADTIFKLCDSNSLNVYYKNDKTELELLKTYLEERNQKVILITSENKTDIEYQNIINNSKLDTCNWFLTTKLLNAGININNTFNKVNLIFGTGIDVTSLLQFKARFRNTKSLHVQILHNYQDTNYYCDLKKLDISAKQLRDKEIEIKKRLSETSNTIEKSVLSNLCKTSIFEYDTNNELEINVLYILSYINLYHILNQVNNLKYFVKTLYVTDVKYLDLDVIERDKTELNKTRKSTQEYNKAKTDKVTDYVNELIDTFQVDNKLKYKQEINKRYFELKELYTSKELKERKELLSISYSKYQRHVNILKYHRNLSLIESNNVSDTSSLDYARTIEIKEMCDKLRNKNFNTLELFEVLNGLSKESLYGVETKSMAVKKFGDVEKRNFFTDVDLSKYISDTSKLFKHLDNQSFESLFK